MPKTVKPDLVILSVPKVGMKSAKVAKIAKPKSLKSVKPVRTGGRYRGSGSSKYWWSNDPTFLCKYCKDGFHTAKERTRHQHQHEAPFHCHNCEYTNVRQDNLSKHMLKKHKKSVAVVQLERKAIRENDPLFISSTKSVAISVPLVPISCVMLPENDIIPIQTIPEPTGVSCQTTFNCKRLVTSLSPEDDCLEVENDGVTSTKFTQTVSVMNKAKGREVIVSNPHPSLIQDVLSKKKTNLTNFEKAVRWRDCGKRRVLQDYKTLEPIVLSCDLSDLPNDIAYLKKLVMKLGVRASMFESKNHRLEKQVASLSSTDKFKLT
jgi:hypothetical protein